MHPDVDAVVVGSGPNGLFAAVALAEAGWRVLVLEAADTPGGGLSTEEVTLPGFRHDICSTAHPMAMASPAFRAVDLAREGLAFAHAPAPVGHPLTLRESAILQRDVAATAATLGRDGPRWSRVMGALAGDADRMLAGVLDPHPRAPARAAVDPGVRGDRGVARQLGGPGGAARPLGASVAGRSGRAFDAGPVLGADHRGRGAAPGVGTCAWVAVRGGRVPVDRRRAGGPDHRARRRGALRAAGALDG